MTSRTGKIVSIRSRSRGGLKQLSQGARPRTIRCGARRQGDPEKRRGFTPLETFGGVQMKRASLTGFTLIELTLVAVIILVLVVLSSPKFRGTFTSLQIDDAAQRMAQVIRYGQHRAIVEERRFRLNLDNTRGVYRLLSESKDTDGGVSEGMAAAFDPIEGRFSDIFPLPDGVAMVSDAKDIDFYPDGRSGKVTINLKNRDGRELTMRTTGRAGYVEILEDADK